MASRNRNTGSPDIRLFGGFTLWELIAGITAPLFVFVLMNGLASLYLVCLISLYLCLIGLVCLYARELSAAFHFFISLIFLANLCLVVTVNVYRGYSGNLEDTLVCDKPAKHVPIAEKLLGKRFSALSPAEGVASSATTTSSSTAPPPLPFVAVTPTTLPPLHRLQEYVALSNVVGETQPPTDGTSQTTSPPAIVEEDEDDTADSYQHYHEHLQNATKQKFKDQAYIGTRCENPNLTSLALGQAIYVALSATVLGVFFGRYGSDEQEQKPKTTTTAATLSKRLSLREMDFEEEQKTHISFLANLRRHWKRLEFENRNASRFTFWQAFSCGLGGIGILFLIHIALLDFLVGLPFFLLILVGMGCLVVVKRNSPLTIDTPSYFSEQDSSEGNKERRQQLPLSYRNLIFSACLFILATGTVVCVTLRVADLSEDHSVQSPLGIGVESPIAKALISMDGWAERQRDVISVGLGLGSEVLVKPEGSAGGRHLVMMMSGSGSNNSNSSSNDSDSNGNGHNHDVVVIQQLYDGKHNDQGPIPATAVSQPATKISTPFPSIACNSNASSDANCRLAPRSLLRSPKRFVTRQERRKERAKDATNAALTAGLMSIASEINAIVMLILSGILLAGEIAARIQPWLLRAIVTNKVTYRAKKDVPLCCALPTWLNCKK